MQTTVIGGRATGQFQAFRDGIEQTIFSVLAKPINELEAQYSAEYLNDAEDCLSLIREAFPDRQWPAAAVEAYTLFVREVLREEKIFRETGAYSAKIEDLERIKKEIYDNPRTMESYLLGLMLTYYSWPHHYELLRFYRREFLSLPGNVDSVMEWGVGHGLLGLNALRRWPKAKARFYDISQPSLNFSRSLLRTAGFEDGSEFFHSNIFDSNFPAADRLICGELLEHVSEPDRLLRILREAFKPGGYAFLTGAVNAPQADHLYLFKSSQEIFEMVDAAGLKVEISQELVHPNRRGQEKPPLVVAMVLSRRT